MGFKQVIDSSFGADTTIINVAAEFISRWKNKEKLPLFTSCCPSWVRYVEEIRPEFKENLASSKSPQMIVGSLIKNDYGPRRSIPANNIFSVSVMPCTAKKYEAERERSIESNYSGIDAVLTTRELIKIIRLFGINFSSLEPEQIENYSGIQSSAGRLSGTAGGSIEGIIRTIYFNMTQSEAPGYKIMEARGFKVRKEFKLKIGKSSFGFAAVSGLANAKILLDEIRNGRDDLQLVEVMAFPNGCVNGGGQRFESDEKTMKSRMKSLYDTDEEDMIRAAHKNPLLADYYTMSILQTNIHKA